MAHEFESGFFARQRAWHGLGVVIPESEIAAKAIEIAGLDWNVDVLPCYDENGKELPAFCSRTVRDSDGVTLGSVSPAYKPIQNRELFEMSDALTQDGAKFETAGSLKGGRSVWTLMNLGENKIIDDTTATYLLLTNNHDGGAAMRALVTDVRVVCNNTLTLALGKSRNMISVWHTGNVQSKIAEAKRIMSHVGEWREKFNQIMLRLADMDGGKKLAWRVAKRLFPAPESDETKKIGAIEEKREFLIRQLDFQPGAKMRAVDGTAYGVLQSCTDYADHFMAVPSEKFIERDRRAASERHMLSVLDGHAARFKERAFDVILEEVGFNPAGENLLSNMN